MGMQIAATQAAPVMGGATGRPAMAGHLSRRARGLATMNTRSPRRWSALLCVRLSGRETLVEIGSEIEVGQILWHHRSDEDDEPN